MKLQTASTNPLLLSLKGVSELEGLNCATAIVVVTYLNILKGLTFIKQKLILISNLVYILHTHVQDKRVI